MEYTISKLNNIIQQKRPRFHIENIHNNVSKQNIDYPVLCYTEKIDSAEYELSIPEIYSEKQIEIYDLELKTIFNRYGYVYDSQRTSNYKLLFTVRKTNDLSIDGNYQLWVAEEGYEDYYKKQCETKLLNGVSHYTDFKSAYNIVKTNEIWSKCLANYNSENPFVLNLNHKKCCFFTSFTFFEYDSDKMWNNFKNKGSDCRIDIEFKHNFYDAIKSSYIITDDSKKIPILFEAELTDNNKDGDIVKDVYARMLFLQPKYYKHNKDGNDNRGTIAINSNCDGVKDYIILDEIANCVYEEFIFQNEVRLAYMLTSTHNVIIPPINRLITKFKKEEIKSIKIIINKKYDKHNQQVERMKELEDHNPLIKVI